MRIDFNKKCEVKCGPISLLLYKRNKDIENYKHISCLVLHLQAKNSRIYKPVPILQTERTNLQHIDARSRFVGVTFEK